MIIQWEIPCDVVAHVLDCNIVVSEFKFQLHCYIHFWSNALRKAMNPFLIPPSYGLNSTTTVFLQGWLWH